MYCGKSDVCMDGLKDGCVVEVRGSFCGKSVG